MSWSTTIPHRRAISSETSCCDTNHLLGLSQLSDRRGAVNDYLVRSVITLTKERGLGRATSPPHNPTSLSVDRLAGCTTNEQGKLAFLRRTSRSISDEMMLGWSLAWTLDKSFGCLDEGVQHYIH